MFNIEIGTKNNPITFRLWGCPDYGVEAIDFRRANKIDAAPNDKVIWNTQIESETLARKLPLNTSADWGYYSYSGEVHVTPAIIMAAMEDPSDESIGALITEIRKMAPWQIESAAESERQKASKAAAETEQRKKREQSEIEGRAAKAKAEKEAREKLRPFFSPEDLFLEARGMLDAETVIHQLEIKAESNVEDKLAEMPLPPAYRGSVTFDTGDEAEVPSEGHYKWLSSWDRDWVPTIQAIEAVTGHPVFGIVRGCLHIFSHLTVPWQRDLLPLRITLSATEND